MSKPSVNQLYTSASSGRALARLPCRCHSRLRLISLGCHVGSCHLRQNHFGLGQPEGHVQGAVQRDRCGEFSVGLPWPDQLSHTPRSNIGNREWTCRPDVRRGGRTLKPHVTRVQAQGDPDLAQGHDELVVHAQQAHRRAPSGSPSNETRPVCTPGKVR